MYLFKVLLIFHVFNLVLFQHTLAEFANWLDHYGEISRLFIAFYYFVIFIYMLLYIQIQKPTRKWSHISEDLHVAGN